MEHEKFRVIKMPWTGMARFIVTYRLVYTGKRKGIIKLFFSNLSLSGILHTSSYFSSCKNVAYDKNIAKVFVLISLNLLAITNLL